MAPLDRARSSAPRGIAVWKSWLPPDRRLAVASGLVAAALSWLTVLLLCALAWGMSPQGTTTFGEVIGVASAVWFLATGGGVTVDGATVGVVPLGMWGLAVWVTGRGWGRVRHTSARSVLTDARDFLTGYAGWVAIAGLFSLLSSARPTPSALFTIWLVPLVALGTYLARHPEELDPSARVVHAWERLPEWARRAGRPALHAVVALALLGALVATVSVVVRWSTVSQIADSVAPGVAGGLVMIVAHVSYVPTFVLWALSFIAGPGFQVAAEGTVSLTGSHPGLLPMIPALGAIPGDATYPVTAWLAVALPVGVGCLLGRSALAQRSLLVSWRTTLGTTLTAVMVAATVVGFWAQLGSGPMGSQRLVHVGPNAALLAGAVAAELAVGAACWFLWVVAIRRLRP